MPNFDYLKARRIANAREFLRDQIAGLSNQLPKYKRLMSYQIQSDPLPRTTTRKVKRLEIKRLIESGELQSSENGQASTGAGQEDMALRESAIGQEVLNRIRTYGQVAKRLHGLARKQTSVKLAQLTAAHVAVAGVGSSTSNEIAVSSTIGA